MCRDRDIYCNTFEVWLLPQHLHYVHVLWIRNKKGRRRGRDTGAQLRTESEVPSWDFSDFFVPKGTTAIMHGVACHTIAFNYACIHPWQGELAKGKTKAQRWSDKEKVAVIPSQGGRSRNEISATGSTQIVCFWRGGAKGRREWIVS